MFDMPVEFGICFEKAVSFIYLFLSLSSFSTLFITGFPEIFRSFPLLKSIILFGKYGTNYKNFSVLFVPKRWFCHFYITAIITSSITLLFSLIYSEHIPSKVALLLVVIQTTKRLYENLFVQIFSDSIMSIAHYLLGHYFYFTMPFTIYWSNKFELTENYLTLGICVAFATIAIILQHIVMVQLANTRRIIPKEEHNSYRLPEGWMFTYVTCPHFALEILIYAIIHVVLGFHLLPFTATFVFVLSNQICSGVLNHKWYLENYSDFAKSRKILIPFLF